ncbi:hypothetical protein Tco_0307184 [Tanacetum coccineum]
MEGVFIGQDKGNYLNLTILVPAYPESIFHANFRRVLFVGSVPEPFSFLVDLNIKSPKYKLAEDKFSFSQLKTSSTLVLQDFQDNPDDEEDTRSSQEYLNDLEEEFHE